ncbi:c-type cytochrome [Jiella sp. M17.18]|uniref:c-type cytochrome n=1 Tax=Jiella sp. M17.18 TaxID=3234247 RepID=UPI0034DEEF24
MDSFEANKIFGAVLGTVFVLFGGSLLAEGLFSSEAPEKPGFEIAVAEPQQGGGTEQKAAAEDPPVAALLQNADVKEGQTIFKKCQACHSGEKGGPNKVGPHLWGVVDRPVASVSDFSYSAGMKKFSDNGQKKWTYDHIYHFIKAPKDYVPGTAMGFAGLKDPQQRADVIAYLRTLNDNPPPLPPPPAEGQKSADAGNGGAPASAEANAETNPATTTQPGVAAAQEPTQTPATTDSQAAAPQPNAQAAPTQANENKPNPPAAQQQAANQANAPKGGDVNAGAEGTQGMSAAPAQGIAQPAPAGQRQAAASSQPAGGTQQAAITGDPAAGKQVFRKCQACHAIGEGAKNKIGPELNGIVGEKVALVEGYNFSSALQNYAKTHPVWTVDELHQWLSGPQKLVPGTKMSFPGLSSQDDINNVIAYLASFGPDGKPKNP